MGEVEQVRRTRPHGARGDLQQRGLGCRQAWELSRRWSPVPLWLDPGTVELELELARPLHAASSMTVVARAESCAMIKRSTVKH